MDYRSGTPRGQAAIPADVAIGHVHLKVADLDRAIAFYRDLLGFAVTARLGDQAAFLAAGGYHHHLALNTWSSRDGRPPPTGSTGLHHFALRYPTRREFARAVRRLRDGGAAIDQAADHGGNEAVYLRDPDDNGIELCWDRPPTEWPRDERGELLLLNDPLDLAAVRAELTPAAGAGRRLLRIADRERGPRRREG